MIQTPEAAFLVMLGGAICLSSLPLRRQMAFPLGALALAIAGLRAGSGTSHLLSRETLASLPAGFRAVTAGLVLLGIIGAVVVAIRAHRSGFWLGPGIILGAGSVRDILAAAPIGLSLLAGMIIVLLAAIGLGIGRVSRIRWLVLEADLRWLGSPPRAGSLARPGIVVLLVGTLCTAFAPHLSVVFVGAAAASWSLWGMHRRAEVRWPVIPAVLTAILGVTYLFIATVAGPEGLAMAGLDALPISPAAETLVAGVLLVASWMMSGLWPLHRWSVAALVAPAAIMMLLRVGLVVAPAGMEHWRPLAVPLAMLALWHAGARRWESGLAVGAAWLAVVSVAPPPVDTMAAAWLLVAGLALELLPPDRDGHLQANWWARWLALMAAGWGGLLALEAGLHGEVVYTVLAGTGIMLAIGGSGQAMMPRAPRTPAPSA